MSFINISLAKTHLDLNLHLQIYTSSMYIRVSYCRLI